MYSRHVSRDTPSANAESDRGDKKRSDDNDDAELNWVGLLQERVAKRGLDVSYEYSSHGPKHTLTHQATCVFNNTYKTSGVGTTKQIAKTAAAREMLSLLKQCDDNASSTAEENSVATTGFEATIDYVGVLQVT